MLRLVYVKVIKVVPQGIVKVSKGYSLDTLSNFKKLR